MSFEAGSDRIEIVIDAAKIGIAVFHQAGDHRGGVSGVIEVPKEGS